MAGGYFFYLREKRPTGKLKIVIGKDTRFSCDEIEQSLMKGFLQNEIEIILLGIVSTPAVSFFVSYLKADLGIMISASHNPARYNGIKFFDEAGKKLSSSEEKRLALFFQKKQPLIDECCKQSKSVYKAKTVHYEKFLLGVLKHTLKKLKVVLDCANGSLFELAPRVFEQAGAQVLKVIGNTPDGYNINERVGSLNPKRLQQEVIETQADIGVGFDGDGDRVIFVNEKGEVIDGDQVLAAFVYFMKDKVSKEGIVGDSPIKFSIGTIFE